MKKPKIIAMLLVAAVAGLTFFWLWSTESEESSEEGSEAEAAQTSPTAPFIAGRVVDSTGSPIAGATVDTTDGARTTTDTSGTFRLEGLEPGTHRLDARADGFVAAGPQVVRRVEVRLSQQTEPGEREAEGVSGLELVLRRPASLDGRVVASGQAVQGASIGIYYLSVDGLSGRLEPFVADAVATTDENGTFSLNEVVPGRLRLLVEADKYAVAESREFYLEPGDVEKGVEIDLDPSAMVFGEVVNTRGKPVQAQLVLRGATLARSRKAVADGTGNYVFRDVPAGTFTLEARAPGYRTEQVNPVEAVVGEPRANDVVMEAASGIFGRVLDPDGEPAPGAFVLLRPPKGRWKTLHTDEDGRFQWDEPSHSRFQATAISPHFGSSGPLSVSVGQESTLELRAGGAVSGRVVGPDGRPVQSFSIGVESIEVDGAQPYRAQSAGLEAVNDSAGRFLFESLRPGKYWFRVQTPRFASASSDPVVVQANREFSGLTIRVGEAGSVSGRVTDSETGRAVAGAVVVLFDPTSPFQDNQTRTDSGGRFSLDGVPPGRRSLRVSKKGYLSTVSGGLEVAPGRDTTRGVAIRKQKPGERMQFQGIGAVLRKTDRGVQIVQAMEGYAASEFGLEANDFIRAVDREPVDGLRLDEVVEKIRGQQGVAVELEVERAGEGRFTVEIERGQVVVKE